ncbi:MAG: 23S rRNA (uracil-5-)-methyltransferase RumA, partial [Firmicutes bacterium]|nr:23S rRNA (uracil-5-)-methyltransferase RumA [Bacillota bacterium]
CRFVADDVQNALSGLPEPPDVIVVDPPRSGIMPKALSQILSYKVPQILYISCNPKTMAENLRAAVLSGYKPSGVTAYDNFPFTRHTECVCLLEYTSIGK